MCHLSIFSHFSEIGVTNRRVPFVSRRIVTGFLTGLATLIRGVEQADWEWATLKLEGSVVQWHIHQHGWSAAHITHTKRADAHTHYMLLYHTIIGIAKVVKKWPPTHLLELEQILWKYQDTFICRKEEHLLNWCKCPHYCFDPVVFVCAPTVLEREFTL